MLEFFALPIINLYYQLCKISNAIFDTPQFLISLVKQWPNYLLIFKRKEMSLWKLSVKWDNRAYILRVREIEFLPPSAQKTLLWVGKVTQGEGTSLGTPASN